MVRIKLNIALLGVCTFLIFASVPAFSADSKPQTVNGVSPPHSKKASKHHSRHKSKKISNPSNPSSMDSQEEVTDQREVSQQSDHSETKRK